MKTLVDWNNALFSHLFPKSSLPELGAIRFSPATAQRQEPAGSKAGEDSHGTRVVLKTFSDERQEAEAIAQHIVELTKGLPADHNETIGILCRARGDLPALLRALKRASIAFTSTDIDPCRGAHRGRSPQLASITAPPPNHWRGLAFCAVPWWV